MKKIFEYGCYHLLAGDPQGNHVHFRRACHSVLARAVNALQGKRDHVFTGAEPSVVQVLTKEELVKGLLVRSIAEYPSFHTYGMRIRSTEVTRPTLTIAKGECYDERTNEEHLEEVAERVPFEERTLRMKARQEGLSYMGVGKLCKTRPTDRAKSESCDDLSDAPALRPSTSTCASTSTSTSTSKDFACPRVGAPGMTPRLQQTKGWLVVEVLTPGELSTILHPMPFSLTRTLLLASFVAICGIGCRSSTDAAGRPRARVDRHPVPEHCPKSSAPGSRQSTIENSRSVARPSNNSPANRQSGCAQPASSLR